MAFLGILRKINKNLPNLLQVILFICIIHYMGQGILLRVQRKLQLGRYSRFKSASTGATEFKKKTINLKNMNRKMISKVTTSTTTTTTPPPPPPDEVIERQMQERIEILHNGCRKWNMGKFAQEGNTLGEEDLIEMNSLPKNPLYQNLLVSEKRKFSFCPVVRAGLNWISKRLLELTDNYDPTDHNLKRQPASVSARHFHPYLSSWDKYTEVLPKYVNFLVVRHPFDRLLASYKSILEDAVKDPHNFLKYGRRIVRTQRKVKGNGKEPTFAEFISFIIERDVRYLDEAWQPVARKCTPCQIPYTTIMHYETLWNDALWTWKQAKLPAMNTTDYVSNSINTEVRRKYFSDLTMHQLAKLHHKYRIDFDLFGYTIDEHMLYAQPGDEPLSADILNSLPISKSNFIVNNEEKSNIKIENNIDTNDLVERDGINDLNVLPYNAKESELEQIESQNTKQIKDFSNFPEALAPIIPNK